LETNKATHFNGRLYSVEVVKVVLTICNNAKHNDWKHHKIESILTLTIHSYNVKGY